MTTLLRTSTPVARPSHGGAVVRHLGWRAVLHLTGGFSVRGDLPPGGCVVVANHSSHADTPALLAALDPGHTPVVAAAADHWFRTAGRAGVCRTVAAGFPVHRDGGGSADLAAAGAVLDAGGTVVVFPSGSRTATAGTCHSGAFRLAAAHGVPVVPVGVTGTSALLPPTGTARRARVSVRIGAPVDVTEIDTAVGAAGDAMMRLGRPTEARTDSRLRLAIARLAARPRAAAVLGVAAFAEAVSWPLLPELTLAALLLASVVAPRPSAARWFATPRAVAVVRLVLAATIGSVLGGLLTAIAARHGLLFPQPLTTSAMTDAVRSGYLAHGSAGVWSQPLSGVPFKVFARSAGTSGVDLGAWAGNALLARGLRLAAVAAVAVLVSRWITRHPRVYPWVFVGGAALFVPGLWIVVGQWR